jgi:hypothetical protein
MRSIAKNLLTANPAERFFAGGSPRRKLAGSAAQNDSSWPTENAKMQLN